LAEMDESVSDCKHRITKKRGAVSTGYHQSDAIRILGCVREPRAGATNWRHVGCVKERPKALTEPVEIRGDVGSVAKPLWIHSGDAYKRLCRER
jgi:hypothetical protein